MFVSNNLIFLELQKTGGSHILRLLDMVTDGKIIGKHNRLKQKDMGNRFVLGSIRNPWDWYVSLWAYGVSNRGAIRHRTTTKVDFSYYNSDLPHDMGKNWLSISELAKSCWNDLNKPISLWENTYQDSNNAEQFRLWLKMLLDPLRRFDIGEGYGFTALSKDAGLMTYRYLRLFSFGDEIFSNRKLFDVNAIRIFDDENSIASGIIRNEYLEADFIELMGTASIELDDETVFKIKSQEKTNSSKRKGIEYYYDQETIELVMRKERFIIDKFSYKRPSLSHS